MAWQAGLKAKGNDCDLLFMVKSPRVPKQNAHGCYTRHLQYIQVEAPFQIDACVLADYAIQNNANKMPST